MVKQGVHSFSTNRCTCIQCEWIKGGICYVVLQQYCQCPANATPTCCLRDWRLVFSGSRLTTLTESRYGPTEGEAALAVAWGLNNAKIFVLACKDLIVIKDHKPLLNIFNHRDLSTITSPKKFKLKGKTLQYRFTNQYSLGKWQKAADAVSRNPTHSKIASIFTITTMASGPSAESINDADSIENTLNAICDISLADINNTNIDLSDQPHCITYPMLVNECHSVTISTPCNNCPDWLSKRKTPNSSQYLEILGS